MHYPWFKLTSDKNVTQGDLIRNCPVFIPHSTIDLEDSNSLHGIEVKSTNIIIMSQACDLAFKKIDFVVACPYFNLSAIEEINPSLKDIKLKEKIRRGNVPGYHMLDAYESKKILQEISIVDFRYVYSLPLAFIESLIKRKPQRLRLLPPYREQLSQAFARFFMRVGLPIDIPSFLKKN